MKVQLVNNKEQVALIKEKLKENNGYCPCRLIKNEDTKCMCKEFRESPVGSTCHCGLFVKMED